MRLAGIDEAGRGAVIGPLVVAGVFMEEEEDRILVEIGVKDSKLLSPQKREEIFHELEERKIEFHYFEILPAKIDRYIINALEIETVTRLLNQARPDRVLLDVPAFGRGIERYCDKVRERLKDKSIDVIGGNKFDMNYAIVGAASIVAKVMRDRKIKELKGVYGDFGSGYPTSRTTEFIRANYDSIKPIVRMKWKTIEKLKTQNAKRKTTA